MVLLKAEEFQSVQLEQPPKIYPLGLTQLAHVEVSRRRTRKRKFRDKLLRNTCVRIDQ